MPTVLQSVDLLLVVVHMGFPDTQTRQVSMMMRAQRLTHWRYEPSGLRSLLCQSSASRSCWTTEAEM